MSIQVRVASSFDGPAVRQVLEASYPELMAQSYAPELLERALPLMTQPNPKLLSSGTYYLAEIDGVPVGCGGWSFEVPGNDAVIPGLAHIRHFATDARFVRRGVGRALFAVCEANARSVDVRRFECQASLNAELFYCSVGFRKSETVQVEMAPGVIFPSLRMVRELTRP